jgi:hypothetical protein
MACEILCAVGRMERSEGDREQRQEEKKRDRGEEEEDVFL